MTRGIRISCLHGFDHQLEFFLEFLLQLQVHLIELAREEQREDYDGQTEELELYVEKDEEDRKRARKQVSDQSVATDSAPGFANRHSSAAERDRDCHAAVIHHEERHHQSEKRDERKREVIETHAPAEARVHQPAESRR